MRITIFLLLLASIILSAVVSAGELETLLPLIEKLPEARALIKEVGKEGRFGFEEGHNPLSDQFGACWDFDRRVICLTPGGPEKRGQMIGSIIFELYNATVTKQLNENFDKALNGQIDREGYILVIEKLEYENSKKASALVEKGIRQGLYPVSARLFTYRSFDEHYHYQKIGGHAEAIGKMYDQISPL